MCDANIDSREGFSAEEEATYDAPQGWDVIEGGDEDMAEACDYFDECEADFEDDGQPTEYEEWQDVYGGDDCYDNCDCYDEY